MSMTMWEVSAQIASQNFPKTAQYFPFPSHLFPRYPGCFALFSSTSIQITTAQEDHQKKNL